MLQARFSVGTNPILIVPANKKRTSITVEMLPVTIESGNTGIVHIRFDSVPTITVGDPSQGDLLLESNRFNMTESYPNDPSVLKGNLFALGSIAGQIIMVTETTRD